MSSKHQIREIKCNLGFNPHHSSTVSTTCQRPVPLTRLVIPRRLTNTLSISSLPVKSSAITQRLGLTALAVASIAYRAQGKTSLRVVTCSIHKTFICMTKCHNSLHNKIKGYIVLLNTTYIFDTSYFNILNTYVNKVFPYFFFFFR